VDLTERKGGDNRRHPWEVARADFFVALLGENGLLTGRDWLDVGAGDAWLASRLRPHLPEESFVTCWDPNYTAEDLEEEHLGVRMTRERPTHRFDRVLMLDVIEHVEDDDAYLSGIVDDLVADTGWVLVSVPAYQWLFSAHDRTLKHHRRYSPDACRTLLARSGLSIVCDGGLFTSLLLPRSLQAVLERVGVDHGESQGVGAWRGGATVSAVLTKALAGDARLSLSVSRRGRALPGLSFWALATRAG
jgi:2-polyprenyl-3-methyl-5-hydroxy-6-metoxy-1,4-benzoquinol methylase